MARYPKDNFWRLREGLPPPLISCSTGESRSNTIELALPGGVGAGELALRVSRRAGLEHE